MKISYTETTTNRGTYILDMEDIEQIVEGFLTENYRVTGNIDFDWSIGQVARLTATTCEENTRLKGGDND